MKTLVKTFAIAALSAITFISNATDKNAASTSPKTFEVGIYQSINTLKMNVMIEKSTDKDLIVVLKDKNGEILASERVNKNERSYHAKFDMSELEDGKYTFEFTKGNEKVTKEVELSTKTDRQIAMQ
ncbi:MAG: hypothetical protein U5N85_23090 [Arcicella sp.]|nr:hypothetical protein [Arcicella sp.]